MILANTLLCYRNCKINFIYLAFRYRQSQPFFQHPALMAIPVFLVILLTITQIDRIKSATDFFNQFSVT
jgi:hypothetical protein